MKKITVVAITSTDHELTKFSVEKTLENTPEVENVLIFSDKKILDYGKYITLKTPFTWEDYNQFRLKEVGKHLETEFVLFIEYDGMSTNKKFWSDEFFDYDYIGAPFKKSLFEKDKNQVGNGGFSMRSTKLMKILSEDNNIQLKTFDFLFSKVGIEDGTICVEYEKYLKQKYKINFSTIFLAKKFSCEWENTLNSFGFHGLWNLHNFLNKQEYEKWLSVAPIDKKELVLKYQKAYEQGGINECIRVYKKNVIEKNNEKIYENGLNIEYKRSIYA
jgi:hypothetical protein